MTSTATITDKRSLNSIKKRWSALQGREFSLDFARAKLLNDVLERLDGDEDNLRLFIRGVLGEHGRRAQKFARMAVAFETESDIGLWSKIGGSAVVLLTSLSKPQRRKVIRNVERALERSGRQNVSIGGFRNIVKRSVGEARYNETLVEPRPNTRAQLNALRSFVLTLLESSPKLMKKMTEDVKEALGIDLVE
jgi:intein/homing endonuclease